ncbi:MAG TPA: hypothetical protein VHD35_08085 [Chitinophagaceae bacterium]|nr:hypothetical protein [Chitinophagaceae bacterium]
MEVHHHPQVEKKGFKEYFLEFLMIFLAVTLGFFAESLREHINDNEKREQYIQSLVEDLETDTTAMEDIIQFDEAKINAFQNIYSCYDTVTKNMKATSCMGVLIKYSKVNRSFQPNDRTYIQLANAGGFRLLKKEDADSILAYENLYKYYHDFESTVYQGTQDNVRNTLNELADFRVNAPAQEVSPGVGVDTGTSILSGPLLFSDDRAMLNKWFNQLQLYLRVIKAQRLLISRLQIKAIDLIHFYKTKHHLN